MVLKRGSTGTKKRCEWSEEGGVRDNEGCRKRRKPRSRGGKRDPGHMSGRFLGGEDLPISLRGG